MLPPAFHRTPAFLTDHHLAPTNKNSLSNLKPLERWLGGNAGRSVGLRGEAYFLLDFFGSFCIKTKKNEEKYDGLFPYSLKYQITIFNINSFNNINGQQKNIKFYEISLFYFLK